MLVCFILLELLLLSSLFYNFLSFHPSKYCYCCWNLIWIRNHSKSHCNPRVFDKVVFTQTLHHLVRQSVRAKFHNQYKTFTQKFYQIQKLFILKLKSCFCDARKNKIFFLNPHFLCKNPIWKLQIDTGILWFGPIRTREINHWTNESTLRVSANRSALLLKPSRHVNFTSLSTQSLPKKVTLSLLS